MNTKNPQRLQRKIEELHKNWELLGDILARLNRERILETRVDEKMRLEQKIADIEAERQQVEQQLDELETQAGADDTREDLASRKPEPHHKPPQPPETPSGQRPITTGKDYFENIAGNVYTGPVTIHQHGGQQSAERRQQEKKQPRKTSKPPFQKTPEAPIIHLRSEPLTVSLEEFKGVFELTEAQRPLKYIQNQFEDQGEVVLDHATGLMWQKSGSNSSMSYAKAQRYVKKLNHQRFAGHDDWRLPTIPELVSLLEPEEKKNGLYMNPIFGVKEKYYWCWSADRLPEGETGSSGAAWLVHFLNGVVNWYHLLNYYYVRCVRSIK